ncbi:hypothetical protein JXR93_04115 [bacterium]|nr:hypothetical protein [bacterium]
MRKIKSLFMLLYLISVVVIFTGCSDSSEEFTIIVDPPQNQIIDNAGILTLKNLKTSQMETIDILLDESKTLNLSLNDSYSMSYENGEYFAFIDSFIPKDYSKLYLTINKIDSFEPFFGKLPEFTLGDCYLYENYNFYTIKDESFFKLSFLGREFEKVVNTTITNCINLDGKYLISENRLITLKNGEILDKILSKNYVIKQFISTEISNGDYFLVTQTESTPNCIRVVINSLELIESKTCLNSYPENGELFFNSNDIYLINDLDLYKYNSGSFEKTHTFEESGEVFYWGNSLYLLEESGEFYTINLTNYQKNRVGTIDSTMKNIIKSEYQLFFASSNSFKSGDSIFYYDKAEIKEITIPDYLALCDIKVFSLDSKQSLFLNKKECNSNGNTLNSSNIYLFTK